MVFCDVELASRIERAERDLVAAVCANIARRLPDIWLQEIGGGLVAYSEPSSPMNKAVGLGFAPFDHDAWQLVEAEHARRQVPLQVELATLGDPAIAAFLTGRGYRLVGVENVLGRPLVNTAPPLAPPGVTIARSPVDEFATWLEVTATGFGTPDLQGVAAHESFDRALLERILGDLAGAEGFVRSLARRDGVPAGAASMRMQDGIAQLCGAATLPAHRRRGVQSALLAHRLGEAAAAGCTLAVVTTQPGSKSQQNVQKQGFALLYSRLVLLREA